MKSRSLTGLIVPGRQGWLRRRVGVVLLAGTSLLLAACGAVDASVDPTATTATTRIATQAAPAGSETTPTPPPAQAQQTTPRATAQVAPTQTPRPLSTPTPLPPPAPAIGDSVQTEGWVFSVTGFETFQRIGDHTASGMFLYLHLTVTNTGSSPAAFPFTGLIVTDHASRTFFLAEEATRETLEWDFGTAMDEPIQPGETRNVAAAFDIALDSTDLKLTSPSRVFEIAIEHRELPK